MLASIKPLEKQAFLGAARGVASAARRALPYVRTMAGKLTPGPAINTAGSAVERGISKGTAHVLGPEAGKVTRKLIKDIPSTMAGRAVSDAAFGGLLEGGLAAAMANPGERGQAFQSGLTSGAITGAGFGAISGGAGQAVRNIRHSALEQAARRRNLAPSIVDKSMDQGFFKNLKTTATGKGPLSLNKNTNRVLAGTNALGQAAGLGAEFYVPMKLMPTEEQPMAYPEQYATYPDYYYPAYKQAEALPEEPKPTFLNTMPPVILGSSAGGVLAGLGTDYLKDSPRFPGGFAGRALTRVLPAAGALTGAYGALRATRAFRADKPENHLQEIDFDKLLRYYKKRDPVSV